MVEIPEVPEDALVVAAGHWWTMNGKPGDGELVIRLEGPPLAARDPARAVVTGFRLVGADEPPAQVWVTVQVRADLWGPASGAGG